MKELEALDKILAECGQFSDAHVSFMARVSALRGFMAAASADTVSAIADRLAWIVAAEKDKCK